MVEIQQILGHSRLDTTAVYPHIGDGELQDAVGAHPVVAEQWLSQRAGKWRQGSAIGAEPSRAGAEAALEAAQVRPGLAFPCVA